MPLHCSRAPRHRESHPRAFPSSFAFSAASGKADDAQVVDNRHAAFRRIARHGVRNGLPGRHSATRGGARTHRGAKRPHRNPDPGTSLNHGCSARIRPAGKPMHAAASFRARSRRSACILPALQPAKLHPEQTKAGGALARSSCAPYQRYSISSRLGPVEII